MEGHDHGAAHAMAAMAMGGMGMPPAPGGMGADPHMGMAPRRHGTYEGHVLPGTFFVGWGLWWAATLVRRMRDHAAGGPAYRSTAWHHTDWCAPPASRRVMHTSPRAWGPQPRPARRPARGPAPSPDATRQVPGAAEPDAAGAILENCSACDGPPR